MPLNELRTAQDLGAAYWLVEPAMDLGPNLGPSPGIGTGLGAAHVGGGWETLFGAGAPDRPTTVDALAQCVHPGDRARFLALLDAGLPASTTLTLATPGQALRVLCRVAPSAGGLAGLWIAQAGDWPEPGLVNAEGEAAAHRALAALPDGVSVYDPEDRLVLTNSRMTDLFGYGSDGPVAGRRFADLVREVLNRRGVPEAIGHEEDWLADLLDRRAQGDIDEELELADGRILRIRDRLLPDGWRVGTRVDVTALHRREQAIGAAMTRLREAIESLPDAVFLLDEEGRFILANDRVRKLFPLMADTVVPGHRFEDMLRIGIERGAYPDAVGREEEWIAEAMAFWNRTDPTVERTTRLANGRWVLAIDRRLPQGGWISLRIDITDVKQNEARLAAILDGAGHTTWEWDVREGRFITSEFTSQTVDFWLASVGYDRSDLTGQPTQLFRRLLHPEDAPRLDAAFDLHVEGRSERIDFEVRQRHKNGSWVWGRVRGKVSQVDTEGRPLRVAGVLVDITDLKRVQLDLERSARLKLEFLERISHEIRTPLNGVLGAVSLLRGQGVSPDQEELIAIAEASGEKLVEMIDRLVELTRLEDGQIAIAPGPIRIDRLAEDLRAAHAAAAAARGIALDVLTDPRASEPRGADAVQLRRMLDRIVDHAIARTALGSIEIRLRTTQPDTVRIEIADGGPTPTEGELSRLLEPLFHEDGNARDIDSGDGLGLWAVKRLAEAMGGTLTVAPGLGGGLVVRLDLPLPVWTGAADGADG